jgi:hypothetical protein
MSQQRGGMRGDDLGTMVPLGGSGSEKELFRPPKDIERISPASGMFIRGRIRPDLAGLYGLAATLAGDHEHTLAFLANMVNANLGVSGYARHEFLMGLSRMLVPSAMPQYRPGGGGNGHGQGQGQERSPNRGGKGKHIEDDE